MGKYLDSGGLSHLMSKIKTWADGAFLKLSGGTMTGKLKWRDSGAVDSFSGAPTYLLGIDSFADGGTTKYASADTVVVGNASKATKDGNGNVITDTYLPKWAELQTTNPFAPSSYKGPYISKIDNALYAADKRWNVTGLIDGTTNVSASDISRLFDGDYEGRYQLAKGKTCVITLDFSSTTYFPGYPYGYILVSFYYNEAPASVSGRVYCNYEPHGVGWKDITFSDAAAATTYSHVYRSSHQGYHNISKLEITITASSSTVASISEIEMHLDRPASSRTPFFSKYTAETLYYPIKWANDSLSSVTKPEYFLAMDAFSSGGTTKYATANNAANALMNALSTGSSNPTDADYYISQYVGGGSTTTTYHRRPMSALWNYIKGKIESLVLSTSTASTSTTTAATSSAVKATYDRITEAVGNQIRISDAAYTGGANTVLYRKLAVLPIDAAGNSSSIIISGRCGGWVPSNFGKIEVLLTNRTSTYSGVHVTAAASSSGSSGMYGFCDIVVYAQSNKSAIVYLKIKSYYAYDLVMQTLSGVTEDYSTDSVTPTGTLVWSLSESPQTKLDPEGTLSAPKFKGALDGNATNVTGTVAIAHGGTGATTAAAAWTALGGGAIGKKASLAASDIPSLDASKVTSGTFDKARLPDATTSVKGAAQLSSATNSSSESLAATPKAVKAAYDLASGASTTAGQALSAATGAKAVKVAYSISNGTVTGEVHVYSAGSEVTAQWPANAYSWSYEVGAGNWVSLGTGYTKNVALSTLGYGGNLKCSFNDETTS